MAAMREAFAATATDLLEADDRVAIVLADISVSLLARAILINPLRAVNVGNCQAHHGGGRSRVRHGGVPPPHGFAVAVHGRRRGDQT